MTSVYEFLHNDALQVAPLLLGYELVAHSREGTVAGRIVEVEAYHGLEDPASHAYHGVTTRTAPMFEAGGTVYVYLSYGLHTCMNIVTGPAGSGQAVLIRALEPTEGLELMARRRGMTNTRLLASGPGRVGQALGITRAMSGSRLGTTLELCPPQHAARPTDIMAGPRIGISTAVDKPWRFWLRDNPFVSKGRGRLLAKPGDS